MNTQKPILSKSKAKSNDTWLPELSKGITKKVTMFKFQDDIPVVEEDGRGGYTKRCPPPEMITRDELEKKEAQKRETLMLREKSLAENLENEYIRKLELEHEQSKMPNTIKEWAKVFPEAAEAIREKIIEEMDNISDAEFRIMQSYWHAKRDPDARPICEAVAEIIAEKELAPHRKNLSRLLWEHRILTAPEQEKKKKRIDAKEVKSRANLKDIAEMYGLRMARSGNRWTCLCPFHNERHASFFIFPDNTFHCFSCQAHGDVFTFIQLKEDVNFKQALDVLSRYYYG